jgi:membrane protein
MFRTAFRIVARAASQFSADNGTQMGAALAYYALFSTAPLLLLAVMVAGLVYGQEAAQARLEAHLTEALGPQSAREITDWMQHAIHPAAGRLAAVVGIGLLLLGSLGAFLHVRRCLMTIWRLTPTGTNSFLLAVIDYAVAIVATLCVGLLLLLSLVVSTAVGVVVGFMGDKLPGGAALWHWVDVGVSFLFLTLFFAVICRVLAGRQIPWSYIWYGAFVTALLFTIGKTLIGLYLAYTSTASIYGAAGSLVIFLLWVYYSAQILFFGAELIQARRTRGEWMSAPSARSREP